MLPEALAGVANQVFLVRKQVLVEVGGQRTLSGAGSVWDTHLKVRNVSDSVPSDSNTGWRVFSGSVVPVQEHWWEEGRPTYIAYTTCIDYNTCRPRRRGSGRYRGMGAFGTLT